MQALFRRFGSSAAAARLFCSSGSRDSDPFAGLVFRFADRDCQDQKPEYGFRHDIGNGVTDLDSHDCCAPGETDEREKEDDRVEQPRHNNKIGGPVDEPANVLRL